MPTLNPWVLLGLLATYIAAIGGGYVWGDSTRNTAWLAKTETDKRKAIEEALTTERENHAKANTIIRQQVSEQAAINTRLRADLAGMRNRPERSSDLSTATRPACTGANGLELARSDAEFLIQFAALAAKQDAALSACYKIIDITQQATND